MMNGPARKELTALARWVILLGVALVVVGNLWHGVTATTIARLWVNIVERPTGPMKLRFVLQPLMAALVAIRDARADARSGRSPYLATVLSNGAERAGRLREGANATARILLLALIMDGIYQAIVLDRFYPNEAVIIALVLAFVPYILIRGLSLRVLRALMSGTRVSLPYDDENEGHLHGEFNGGRGEPVRSQGDGGQSFCLDPHAPQR